MAKRLPKHIAIIMDGNRRWARKKGLSIASGHKEGVKALRRITQSADSRGIKYLTVYSFSTENWFRKKVEIIALLNLMEEVLENEVPRLDENNVKLKIIGDIDALPESLRRKIVQAERKLSKNKGLVLIVAINYGGRAEIVEACKKAKVVTEKNITDNLYTRGFPDPDLLIRTGGVARLSNFLLWQAAYTELYFTDVLWPDFKESHLDKAILDYNKRERRFGK